jgi:hypothetical protein
MNSTPLLLLGMAAATGCSARKSSPAPAPAPKDAAQYTVGIVRIDTRGVVVDDRIEDRSWVDVDLAFVEGTVESPAGPGDEATWTGHAAIHIRGNSSVGYDKKQYALETRDAAGNDLDATFFGLPEEEDWVLHAPYSDKTLMRNHLMFTWSRAIGRYAPRTRFVELFMEDGGEEIGPGDYRGLYVLTEKIKRDKHRVNLEKLGPSDSRQPDVSGGYLLRRDWIEQEAIETEIYGDEIMVEYPKAKDITSAQWDYIEGHLNDFEAALERRDGSHSDHADLESFADHMMMMELSRNVDAYVLSTYMHKPRNGRLTMGPIWDFNGSLGNADYFESWETEGWHYENSEFPGDNPNGFHWYEQLLQDPEFQDLLSARWSEHRAGPWSDSSLMADIDATALMLSDAQEHNFARWPVIGEYIWPNDEGAVDRETHADEVDYLKTWLIERTAWLDSQWLE